MGGWKALTGTTDFGKISSSKDEACKLAFDVFVDRIAGFVGNYYVKLKGQVDALVFAGGIGEKSEKLRKAVIDEVRCLGFDITNEQLEIKDVVMDISKEDEKGGKKVLVVQTDEQLEMARSYIMDGKLTKG